MEEIYLIVKHESAYYLYIGNYKNIGKIMNYKKDKICTAKQKSLHKMSRTASKKAF